MASDLPPRSDVDGAGDSLRLAHGAGGGESRDLVRGVFLSALAPGSPVGMEEDAALVADGMLAITTDSFLVDPPFFPGGDIGKLAVCGAANDLLVRGAVPSWLAAAWVLPEGFPLDALGRLVRSMASTASAAGIEVVTGDTKVVAAADLRGPVVTTCAVGQTRYDSGIGNVTPGDLLVVTGGVGEHAAALLATREGLLVPGLPPSDCAVMAGVLRAGFGAGAHFARDATRGGVGAVVHEVAEAGPHAVTIHTDAVPVHPAVSELCQVLGMSPLDLACEGRVVLAVRPDRVSSVLRDVRAHPAGAGAAVIGQVMGAATATVDAVSGGTRTPLPRTSTPLPRLC